MTDLDLGNVLWPICRAVERHVIGGIKLEGWSNVESTEHVEGDTNISVGLKIPPLFVRRRITDQAGTELSTRAFDAHEENLLKETDEEDRIRLRKSSLTNSDPHNTQQM